MEIKSKSILKEAIITEYCNYCGLPLDYCEYAQCHVRTNKSCESTEIDHLSSNLDSKVGVTDPQVPPENSQKKTEEYKVNKKKKTKQNSILIKVESRARRKSVTVVSGLELFNIQLNEAAKKFAKQFSCGASVVKGCNGKPDQIDVQGDFDMLIAEFILKIYPQIEANNIILQT
ncbi:Translation initiation factor SUI1 family protein [Cryptosporidium felis]|nr:Translation initiation factor SUI1 family protein [Cryptosporidium felis]